MQTEQIRIRIEKADGTRLRKAAEKLGVNYTVLVPLLIRAGVEAIEKNGRLALPVRFIVSEE